MTEALVQYAADVRESAYAPYSQFKVGAALSLLDGRIFQGANVENASYGLAICAERSAVAAAVAGGAKPGDVLEVAIVVASPKAPSPCGACRQVLSEFMTPGGMVIIRNLTGDDTRRFSIESLLPNAFGPGCL